MIEVPKKQGDVLNKWFKVQMFYTKIIFINHYQVKMIKPI